MSLAMFEGAGSKDAGERIFRFTVRADRSFSHRVEKAARAAGMSVTAFVQAHFDTILDEPADADGFSPDDFARQHYITVAAAKLWKAMATAANGNGLVTGSARDLAAPAGLGNGHASDHLHELVDADLVVIVRRAGGKGPGTYRVVRS